ncbi:MAG: hypothetical protein AAFP90_22685, partial [Planctomycetota bacterium]
MRNIPLEDAYKLVPKSNALEVRNQVPTISYAHDAAAIAWKIDAKRRKPLVSMRQVMATLVDPGVVKSDITLYYNVQFSGVKELRVGVPREIADQLRVTDRGVRHSVVDDADDDTDDGRDANEVDDDSAEMTEEPDTGLPDGYIVWKLQKGNEWFGSGEIHLSIRQTTRQLQIGESMTMDVPRIIHLAADRSWGQVVIGKGESLDVRPESVIALRGIDPAIDLIAEAKNLSFPDGNAVKLTAATRAFQWSGDWALKLRASRFALQTVKRTSVPRGLVRMLVTRSDKISVSATYRIRTTRQRIAISLPADATFDSQPVRVDGRSVALERGTVLQRVDDEESTADPETPSGEPSSSESTSSESTSSESTSSESTSSESTTGNDQPQPDGSTAAYTPPNDLGRQLVYIPLAGNEGTQNEDGRG